jgi:hypothetical protein
MLQSETYRMQINKYLSIINCYLVQMIKLRLLFYIKPVNK